MEHLRLLREKAGLTQAQLAEQAGTSQPQIRRLENGERELTRAWAERLAGPLHTTAVALVFPEVDAFEKAKDDREVRALLRRIEYLPADLVEQALGAIKMLSGRVAVRSVSSEDRDLSQSASPRHESEPSR